MNISKIREISDIYKENIACLIGGKIYYRQSRQYFITEIKYEITKKDIIFYENHIDIEEGSITWHERLKFPLETAEHDIKSMNASIEKVLER